MNSIKIKDIKSELKKMPTDPGVYLMKDHEDNLIYVGKAKNLRNRVRSYFQNEASLSPKVYAMVQHIDHFDYMLVENEVEALVLESNFIKEHRPHYNILLRDDKQYPYIKITNEKFPQILKVRKVSKDKANYYGPFPNAFAVNDIIDLLRSIYKIRSCNLDIESGKRLKRPCMYYYIGKCPAPCRDLADEGIYMTNIGKVKSFLQGNHKDLVDKLTDAMKTYAEDLDFEQAATYRDYLASVEYISEKQKITNVNSLDIDFIASARNETTIAIQIFFMRNGKFVDQQYFIIDSRYKEDDGEVMSSFLKQFYLDQTYVPKEIYVDKLPDDKSIEDFLSGKNKSRVNIKTPKIGEKKKQLDMVKNNAFEMLKKHERYMNRREKSKNLGLEELKKLLKMEEIKRIEAYDISNIYGAQNVGSMVVFEDGIKASKEYRKFKIKTVEGPDDYSSQREMLTRRFNRYVEFSREKKIESGFGKKPDLIIMDGGKGQVNICQEVIREFEIDIKVIGLVKDEKHRTRAIISEGEEIPLSVNSSIYRFLYRIQEEVHRFAINYHKNVRKREMLKSELDEIPGVGEKRKESLLKKFKSVSKIKSLSEEELCECEGISPKVAKNIVDHFERSLK